MLNKKMRTVEKYMRAGAMMRLYKTLGAKLLTEISGVLSSANSHKMMRAMQRIGEVCSNAEENMFHDYPQLSDLYIDVFYGAIGKEQRNDVDRKITVLARKAADDLFR